MKSVMHDIQLLLNYAIFFQDSERFMSRTAMQDTDRVSGENFDFSDDYDDYVHDDADDGVLIRKPKYSRKKIIFWSK